VIAEEVFVEREEAVNRRYGSAEHGENCSGKDGLDFGFLINYFAQISRVRKDVRPFVDPFCLMGPGRWLVGLRLIRWTML
jgi:hypothetical protein